MMRVGACFQHIPQFGKPLIMKGGRLTYILIIALHEGVYTHNIITHILRNTFEMMLVQLVYGKYP